MAGSGNDPRFSEVDEAIAVTLRFPGNGFATFVNSFNTADIDSYKVVGTSGILEINPGFRPETATRMVLTQGGEVTTKDFEDIDHFGSQTAYFSNCILTGTQPEPDGYEGLADVRALLAIEQAAKTGQPQAIANPPRERHPTPDMARSIPRTDRRLVL